MAEIVNLRQARKRRARADKEARADENRRLHGRTREEKELERDQVERARKHLDRHRRDDQEQ